MRLRRVGAKKQPRYRVVVAQARAPRDGDFVENIGFYDPLTEPATVRIDRDKALSWLSKGAQPSDTVERLLRKAGIIEGEARVYPVKEPAPVAQSAAPAALAAAPAAAEPAAAETDAEEPTDGNSPAVS